MKPEVLTKRVLNFAKRLLLNASQLPDVDEGIRSVYNAVVGKLQQGALSDIPGLFAELGINAQQSAKERGLVCETIYNFLLQCLMDQGSSNQTCLSYTVLKKPDALPGLVRVHTLLNPADLARTLMLRGSNGTTAHLTAIQTNPALAMDFLTLFDCLTDEGKIEFLEYNKALFCHLAFEKDVDLSDALLTRLSRLAETQHANVLRILNMMTASERILLATAIRYKSPKALDLLRLIEKLGLDTLQNSFMMPAVRLLEEAIHHHPELVEPLLCNIDYFPEKDRNTLLSGKSGLCALTLVVLHQPSLVASVLERVGDLTQNHRNALLLRAIDELFLQKDGIPANDCLPRIVPVVSLMTTMSTKELTPKVFQLLTKLDFTNPVLLDLFEPLFKKFMKKTGLNHQDIKALMGNLKGNYPVLLPAIQKLDSEGSLSTILTMIIESYYGDIGAIEQIFTENLEPEQQLRFKDGLRFACSKLLWDVLFGTRQLPIHSLILMLYGFPPEDQRAIMTTKHAGGHSLLDEIALLQVSADRARPILGIIQQSNPALFDELLALIEARHTDGLQLFQKRYEMDVLKHHNKVETAQEPALNINDTEASDETVLEMPAITPIAESSGGWKSFSMFSAIPSLRELLTVEIKGPGTPYENQ